MLTQCFADFYDAFADMDADRDGKVSLGDFQQAIQNLEGGEDLSRNQIDSTFNKCGVDADGFIVLKGLLAAFMGTASRSATDTGGVSPNIISRAFEEVLIECKVAEGMQKFITVPSTMGWTDLLQKLKHKYGRAVTFMYEADGHSYCVKDEMDFKLCWDSVDEAFPSYSRRLVAFIINLDPSKIKSSSHTGGVRVSRKSLLAPTRVTLGQVQDDAGHAESVARRQAQKEAFEAKNEWIDNMMRKTGVSDAEPSSMRKKGWDKLLKACHELDTRREKTMNIDMFKKALQRVDPSITDDQMAWYVEDAKRTAAAKKGSDDVFYEKYCELKQTGNSVSELQGMDDDTVRGFEMQIRSAMKDRYRSIQAALNSLDKDKDGFIHKREFRYGIEY